MIPEGVPLPPSPSEIGKALADPIIRAIQALPEAGAERVAKMLADGAAWVLGGLGSMLDRSITPQLDAAWFSAVGGPLDTMWRIARPVALAMLFLGVMQALVHGSVGELVRRAIFMPAVGGIVGLMAVGVAQMVSDAVAWMSATMVASSTGGPGAALAGLGTLLQEYAVLQPGAIGGLSPLVMLLGLILWVQLLAANAAVYLALLFWPIAMASLMWGAAAGVAKRLAQIIVGLLLVPFVVTAALVLGTNMLMQFDLNAEALGVIVAGVATIFLAVLSPLVLVSFVGATTSAVSAGMGSRALSAARHGGGYHRTTSPPVVTQAAPAKVLGHAPRPTVVAAQKVAQVATPTKVIRTREYELPKRELVKA